MTEEEAKTKWCPMARTRLSDGIGGNRMDEATASGDPIGSVPLYGTFCIGSACMAWRISSGALCSDPEGYCGLARQ